LDHPTRAARAGTPDGGTDNSALRSPSHDYLLAHPELVSLERSLTYLVSRLRTRTPLDAAEFLMVRAPAPSEKLLRNREPGDWSHGRRAPSPEEERSAYEYRCRSALNCMAIYRQVLPDHYARSTAPLYSTQREHEFYRLIDDRENFFPLEVHPEVPLDALLQADPHAHIPFIPVSGKQKFAWQPGLFDLEEIPIPFQLAVTLGWVAKDNQAWETLVELYDLDRLNDFEGIETPAPPLAAVGWTQFVYNCKVENTPLKWLPLAFDMISYKTGNVWLDLPTGVGSVGFEWSLEEVMKLSLEWAQAKDTAIAMTTLDNWFAEDPAPRIAAAVRRWNEAARVEVQSGYAGMLPQDLIEAGVGRLAGRDRRGLLVALPHGLLEVPAGLELLITEGAVEFENSEQ
jgi:hypothetical protein